MGRIRQEQVLKSDVYDDSLSSGVGLETGADDLEDDLNGLRSQVQNITGEANWYDPPGTNLAAISPSFTAGEDLLLGDVVVFNSDGEVVKASATFASGIWRSVGSARGTVLSGALVGVGTSGATAPVLFSVAPAAIDNGAHVFLSTTAGVGTLVPPLTSGTVRFVVGILQGADGVTTTPDVLIQPQFISRLP